MADTQTVNVEQVIGKTFFAKKKLPVYSSGFDYSQPVGYVQPGDMIGVVYSWLNPVTGIRSKLWWMIDRGNADYIFMPHDPDAFSFQALQQQGVKTNQQLATEKAEQEAKENNPVEYYVKNYGKWILITAAVIGLGSAAIKKL